MSRGMLIIPAYNEAQRLAGVLDAVAASAAGLDVVVVDDGSRDDTAAIARRCGARLLRHPVNLGYGAALQTGYKYALRSAVPWLVQMDADGQHDPRDLAALIEPVERGDLDLVIGSRFLAPTTYRMSLAKSAGRRCLQALGLAFGLRVSDPTSGFQAMNRRVVELYAEDSFPSDFPDLDVLLALHRRGLRIGERPVEMAGSTRSSLLHSGLAPVYYVYKMLLTILCSARKPPTS